jgi:hypothetical protein
MKYFRKPSPFALATAELEEARRQLLLAHTGAEYAQAMVAYQIQRVTRLSTTVAEMAKESAELGN